MTRGTNLMQQLWFIIINNSTCFRHLYVHLQEFRLCTAACGYCGCGPKEPVCSLVHCVWVCIRHNLNSWRWTCRCPKHVELYMIINHNCCIKLVPLIIFNKLSISTVSKPAINLTRLRRRSLYTGHSHHITINTCTFGGRVQMCFSLPCYAFPNGHCRAAPDSYAAKTATANKTEIKDTQWKKGEKGQTS